MHDCSLCGCACYCHGDIDDCQVETIEYAYMHCDGCGCGEDPHEFYEDEYADQFIGATWVRGLDDACVELSDFDEWREDYIPSCVMHRRVHCSRCHA